MFRVGDTWWNSSRDLCNDRLCKCTSNKNRVPVARIRTCWCTHERVTVYLVLVELNQRPVTSKLVRFSRGNWFGVEDETNGGDDCHGLSDMIMELVGLLNPLLSNQLCQWVIVCVWMLSSRPPLCPLGSQSWFQESKCQWLVTITCQWDVVLQPEGATVDPIPLHPLL